MNKELTRYYMSLEGCIAHGHEIEPVEDNKDGNWIKHEDYLKQKEFLLKEIEGLKQNNQQLERDINRFKSIQSQETTRADDLQNEVEILKKRNEFLEKTSGLRINGQDSRVIIEQLQGELKAKQESNETWERDYNELHTRLIKYSEELKAAESGKEDKQIIITEEELLKRGFNKLKPENSYSQYHFNGFIIMKVSNGYNLYAVDGYFVNLKKNTSNISSVSPHGYIKYIDQLEKIYFALKNEELLNKPKTN